MAHMDDLFGCNVFNDAVMQQRLPKDTYKALKKTIDEGRHLDPQVAAVVAPVSYTHLTLPTIRLV